MLDLFSLNPYLDHTIGYPIVSYTLKEG